MPRTSEAALCAEQVVACDIGPEADERWPLAYSALFVLVSSALLWSLIIGAAYWLMR